MPPLTNLPKSPISPVEMRIKAASSIARLQIDVDIYQRRMESASETSDVLTEIRLNAAVKVAALKIEADKYQQFEKPFAETEDISSEKRVLQFSTPTKSIYNHERQRRRGFQNLGKTKVTESNWFVKKAIKFLGNFGIKNRLRTK